MKTVGIAFAILLLSACGSVPAKPAAAVSASPASVTTPPASSATPNASQGRATPLPSATSYPIPYVSPTLLFAVLEAKGTANAWTLNTVAIAGVDGYARAKTTFAPMPTPNVGCMGTVLPPSAHVAAGKVFFADGHGVIRSLAIDGTITTVTSFPMTSTQQELSFAVSPDGGRILGTILTLPLNMFPCSGSASTSMATFDAYTAASGAASVLVYHETLARSQYVMALTGWDALGPIGTYPTVWASQGGGPGSTLGTLVRIDPATLKVTATVGTPSSCLVWDSVQSGAFVCTKDAVPTSKDPYGPLAQPVSIRDAAGREEWQFTVTSVNGAFSPQLSPDENHVVICCDFDTSSVWLVDRQGHQKFLPKGFVASGWLDTNTVFGTTGQTRTLAYVALNAPAVDVSMGFSGLVVGTVRG